LSLLSRLHPFTFRQAHLPLAYTAVVLISGSMASACFTGLVLTRVFNQRWGAAASGSMRAFSHQTTSFPERVNVAMVAATQQARVLITHLAAERAGVRDAQMMGV
jgi:hypothetical protein